MLGAINVLKPTGWTSSDVVVKVRGILRALSGDKNIKVGHLGTLDPAGSGVLPILYGKATRLFDYFADCDKLYRATFVFGKTTDTLDSYGVVTECNRSIPALNEIEKFVPEFVGEISQVPPQYSRIVVDGKRACDVARSGGALEIKSRKVTVKNINIISYIDGILKLDIHCSGGTYVRSICRDLANCVGTIAYMSSIIRMANKSFNIEDSATLDELFADISPYMIDIVDLLQDEERCSVTGDEQYKLLNGVAIPPRGIAGNYVVMMNDKVFGICRDNIDCVKVIVRLWE